MVRVGQYGRASHLNERSVDSQLAETQAWVDREPNWRTVFVLRDDGISASKYRRGREREDWPKVMAAIEAGEIDVLLVWEISRASRDRMVFAALFAACQASGVKIGVGGRLHDLDDPDDSFMLDLGAALAVRESGVTSKRIKRGARARAVAGKPHGRIPMGYRRVYDDTTKAFIRQEVDPESAAVVREIVDRSINGQSMNSIANDFNRRGVPTPSDFRHRRLGTEPPKKYRWIQQQVRRIAIDPTFAGQRTHNGNVVGEAVWPAIVTEDEHAALVARLTDPARVSVNDWTPNHLGTGLFRCGKCGAGVRRIKNRGSHSYDCSRWHHVARVMSRTDELVTEVVIARLERPDAADLFVADDSRQKAALQELKTLEARLDAFTEQAAEGNLSAERLAKLEQKLVPQIEAARTASAPVDLPDEVGEMLRHKPREVWEKLDLHQKRRVLRAVVTVYIRPRPPGHNNKVWKPELIYFDWHHKTPEEAAAGELPFALRDEK